jgi:hypothetical protein
MRKHKVEQHEGDVEGGWSRGLLSMVSA